MDIPINSFEKIAGLLEDDQHNLLNYQSRTIPSEKLHKTGPNHIDDIFGKSDRNPQVLRNLFSHCITLAVWEVRVIFLFYLSTRE